MLSSLLRDLILLIASFLDEQSWNRTGRTCKRLYVLYHTLKKRKLIDDKLLPLIDVPSGTKLGGLILVPYTNANDLDFCLRCVRQIVSKDPRKLTCLDTESLDRFGGSLKSMDYLDHLSDDIVILTERFIWAPRIIFNDWKIPKDSAVFIIYECYSYTGYNIEHNLNYILSAGNHDTIYQRDTSIYTYAKARGYIILVERTWLYYPRFKFADNWIQRWKM